MYLYVCFEFKILDHTNQPEQNDLSYPGYDEQTQWRKSPAFIPSTTRKLFLRIIQVISDTFSIHIGKQDPFRLVYFATMPFFFHTDSYHPHKCLKIDFFKPVHIQFHQAVQPSDKLYPSCIPFLLEEDCNISIFEKKKKKSYFYFILYHKMSSANFFWVWETCWLHMQHQQVFGVYLKGFALQGWVCPVWGGGGWLGRPQLLPSLCFTLPWASPGSTEALVMPPFFK